MVSYVAKPDEEFLTFYVESKKLAGNEASTEKTLKFLLKNMQDFFP